jgi:hypothetical protein
VKGLAERRLVVTMTGKKKRKREKRKEVEVSGWIHK